MSAARSNKGSWKLPGVERVLRVQSRPSAVDQPIRARSASGTSVHRLGLHYSSLFRLCCVLLLCYCLLSTAHCPLPTARRPLPIVAAPPSIPPPLNTAIMSDDEDRVTMPFKFVTGKSPVPLLAQVWRTFPSCPVSLCLNEPPC